MAAGSGTPRPLQVGAQYGRLTLLALSGPPKRGWQQWQCRCACGNVVTVWQYNLRSGRTKSCGCLRKELVRQRRRQHGETAGKHNTPEYTAWQRLRQNAQLCPQWRASFAAFLAAVGRRPSPEHILMRTPPGQAAGPGTVAWIPRREVMQERFRRVLRVGREAHTVREWGRIVRLSHATIYNRLASGWPAKQAIFTPARPGVRPPRGSAARRPSATAKK